MRVTQVAAMRDKRQAIAFIAERPNETNSSAAAPRFGPAINE
jgi:hypothetical protein